MDVIISWIKFSCDLDPEGSYWLRDFWKVVQSHRDPKAEEENGWSKAQRQKVSILLGTKPEENLVYLFFDCLAVLKLATSHVWLWNTWNVAGQNWHVWEVGNTPIPISISKEIPISNIQY